MAGNFIFAAQFFDEAIAAIGAVGAYVTHRDESVLAQALTKAVVSAVEDALGDVVSDEMEEKIETWVGDTVDFIEEILMIK
jgi:hypothetical protein